MSMMTMIPPGPAKGHREVTITANGLTNRHARGIYTRRLHHDHRAGWLASIRAIRSSLS
jgi:hypothetical protein